MIDDSYWRLIHYRGKWELQVMVVQWEGPHQPIVMWRPIRTWDAEPEPSVLNEAKREACYSDKYIRYCTRCGRYQLKGHMHNEDTCQGCAERYLGIVH
jgi:hypothetical protein